MIVDDVIAWDCFLNIICEEGSNVVGELTKTDMLYKKVWYGMFWVNQTLVLLGLEFGKHL
jgi:hypothetical protein